MPRKGDFNTPRVMNINKDMKLDTYSTFHEGVQKTNKSVQVGCLKSEDGVMQEPSAFRVQPIKEVHVF